MLIPGSIANDLCVSTTRREAKNNSLGVSQLGNKRLDSPLLSTNDHLCEDSSVGSCAGRTTDPPLGSAEMRGVDDELIGFRVEGRGRLEPSDVGSVSELGHSETTDDTVEAKHTTVDPVACESAGDLDATCHSQRSCEIFRQEGLTQLVWGRTTSDSTQEETIGYTKPRPK